MANVAIVGTSAITSPPPHSRAFVGQMLYYIRNKCKMAIEINTCGGERNFICNWLCIEILIEVYFNAVWLSFISVMYIVKLQIVFALAQVLTGAFGAFLLKQECQTSPTTECVTFSPGEPRFFFLF
jgi:hypothetical protein